MYPPPPPQAGVEGPTRPGVVVQERRLHVGVHNGWGFLEEPQVVLLELQVPPGGGGGGGGGGKGRGDGTAKQATLTKDRWVHKSVDSD